jgi:hypothetical protein
MRRFTDSLAAAACALAIGAGAAIAAEPPAAPPAPSPPSAPPADRTIALVLSLHRHAIYETADRKECPDGLNVGQNEQYLAQFPTELARAAHEVQFGYGYGNRGPKGENVLAAPLSVEDLIPFKPSQSVLAPGIDLDDKVSPEDYTSPDGRKGINNQFNRILGCVEAFRKGGLSYYTVNRNLHLLSQRMIFVISDVDDLRNDPHVTVKTYRGFDPINYSTDDKPTPGGTQRLDRERGARFESVTSGKIVDGVLITDPVDLNMPWRPNTGANDYKLRGARLRVTLAPKDDGYYAEGYLGGFADIETWWAGFSKAYGGRMQDISNLSAPSVYRALLKYADGYPDKEGRNTAVSIEYEVQFVSVHIVPGPDAKPARVADRGQGQ